MTKRVAYTHEYFRAYLIRFAMIGTALLGVLSDSFTIVFDILFIVDDVKVDLAQA